MRDLGYGVEGLGFNVEGFTVFGFRVFGFGILEPKHLANTSHPLASVVNTSVPDRTGNYYTLIFFAMYDSSAQTHLASLAHLPSRIS